MDITIVSDTICPWCFIGKRRLEQALAQRPMLQSRIHWQPFFLNPDMPPAGMPRRDYLRAKFGGEDNAQAIYARIAAAGQDTGIDFRFEAISRTPNTLDSHRLLHWAASRGVQHELAEELFRRYFQDGEDIGDPVVLTDVATAVGLDTTLIRRRLSDDEDRDSVIEAARGARRLGVEGVPFFILDNRYGLSGAQPLEVLLQVIDRVMRENAAAAPADAHR